METFGLIVARFLFYCYPAFKEKVVVVYANEKPLNWSKYALKS